MRLPPLHFIMCACIVVAGLFLESCTERTNYCGVSFCLTSKPALFERKEEVDFNTYRVSYNGTVLLIYEGNYPSEVAGNDLGSISPQLLPPGFVEGRMYSKGTKFSAVLRTPHREWPTYVVVSSENVIALDRTLNLVQGNSQGIPVTVHSNSGDEFR